MRTKQMFLPLIPSSREISTTELFLSSVVRYLETTDSYKKHCHAEISNKQGLNVFVLAKPT